MTDTEHAGRGAGAQPPGMPIDLTKRPQPSGGMAGFTVDLHKPGPAAPPPPGPLPALNLTKPTAAQPTSLPVSPPPQWEPPGAATTGSRVRAAAVIAAVAALAIVVTAVATYALTRPDSGPGGSSASGGTGRGGGAATAITPCLLPPQVSVQSVAMTGSGLGVTADLFSSCSGGDVLNDPQLQLALVDGSHDVAAGVFDTESDPGHHSAGRHCHPDIRIHSGHLLADVGNCWCAGSQAQRGDSPQQRHGRVGGQR